MADLFTLNNLLTLAMLVLLQAVLGFDNLLYISIESGRVPEARQRFVRQFGIALAIILRIVLLFVLVSAIESFKKPFFTVNLEKYVVAEFNLHSFVVLLGGVFIIYTALKEIMHMLVIEDIEGHEKKNRQSVTKALFWIVAMNLVFSFDSILSVITLTDSFIIMATAIVIGGILMIALVNHVAEFLKKNRMYEVLGLFILFLVGIMLLSEGGHLAHLKLLGHAIEPMATSTFYFVIAVLVLIDIVQGRYRKKLQAQRRAELAAGH